LLDWSIYTFKGAGSSWFHVRMETAAKLVTRHHTFA